MWKHIAFSTSLKATKVYIDGVQSGSYRNLIWNDLTGTEFVVGYTRSPVRSANQFIGQIDDLRIYNRALSEDEVKALYEFEQAN